jgi:hypothetical protein
LTTTGSTTEAALKRIGCAVSSFAPMITFSFLPWQTVQEGQSGNKTIFRSKTPFLGGWQNYYKKSAK